MSYNNKATREDIKENVEQFLDLYPIDEEKPGDPNLDIEPDTRGGLVQATVEVPADETSSGNTYKVQVCPICGETQPANFEAFKKHDPEMAEELLRRKRESQAERYVDTGVKPVDEEVLKSRVEAEIGEWDNNTCETRHPPLEPELKL